MALGFSDLVAPIRPIARPRHSTITRVRRPTACCPSLSSYGVGRAVFRQRLRRLVDPAEERPSQTCSVWRTCQTPADLNTLTELSIPCHTNRLKVDQSIFLSRPNFSYVLQNDHGARFASFAIVSLFETCIQGYRILSDTKRAPQDAQNAACRIRVEKAVLASWEAHFEIYSRPVKDQQMLSIFLM